MLSIAISLVLMRYLQGVHHSLINLILCSWGSLQTIAMALIVGELKFPQGFSDACLMLITGLLVFIGQTFLAIALQLEEAGPVSLLRTSEVVFAFIWQFLFLNIYPDTFR
jgi:drug/metabolite transporter (DMT)-like permease